MYRLQYGRKKRAFKKITTRVPCSRHFVSNAAHRDYMTEIHGHKCVEFSVSLSDLGSVCFVPERIWDSLGRAAVLSDSHLCPCKDTKTCTRSMKLSDTATYLLYVTPTSDRGSSNIPSQGGGGSFSEYPLGFQWSTGHRCPTASS